MAKSKTNTAAQTTLSARDQFLRDAKPVTITVNGTPLVAEAKISSQRSAMWYANGNAFVDAKPETKDDWATAFNQAPLTVEFDDGQRRFSLVAPQHHFKTGNAGWYLNGQVLIQGRVVQIGGNFTVVGAKEANGTDLLGSRPAVHVGVSLTVVHSKEWAE